MRFLGGHLGSSVSALVDGQLDHATTERAWDHVLGCALCRAEVEREIWVKNRLALLAGDEPAPRLVRMLHELASSDQPAAPGDVPLLPDTGRSVRARRLTALALLGVGSVSAAVLAVATWGGPLGLPGGSAPPAVIGEATPTPVTPTPVTPTLVTPTLAASTGPGSSAARIGPGAGVSGTLEGWRTVDPGLAVRATATPDR